MGNITHSINNDIVLVVVVDLYGTMAKLEKNIFEMKNTSFCYEGIYKV